MNSSEFISITDNLFLYMLAALYEDHRVDECHHLVFIFEFQLHITLNARHLADLIYVGRCVVLVGWCPRCNYLGNCCAVVVADISTYQHKASAHTIDHGNELLKVGVCRFTDLAEPNVTNTYVQRVVVADAAGDDA